jgi:hypothetical protein
MHDLDPTKSHSVTYAAGDVGVEADLGRLTTCFAKFGVVNST